MRLIKEYKEFEFDNDVKQFTNYCEQVLDLNRQLSDEYYYNSVTSCIIDAVFSIGINYNQTKKAVERYNQFFNLKLYRDRNSGFSSTNEQDSIENLIKQTQEFTPDGMANEVYKNRCRTSTHKSSILKSEAVMLFAQVLKEFGINYLQDVQNWIGNEELEKKIRKIPGQSTGISLDYFFMLAGDDSYVKMDRMMMRFCKTAIGRIPDKYETRKIVISAVDILKQKYPKMTPRLLDHQLWLYQKDVKL